MLNSPFEQIYIIDKAGTSFFSYPSTDNGEICGLFSAIISFSREYHKKNPRIFILDNYEYDFLYDSINNYELIIIGVWQHQSLKHDMDKIWDILSKILFRFKKEYSTLFPPPLNLDYTRFDNFRYFIDEFIELNYPEYFCYVQLEDDDDEYQEISDVEQNDMIFGIDDFTKYFQDKIASDFLILNSEDTGIRGIVFGNVPFLGIPNWKRTEIMSFDEGKNYNEVSESAERLFIEKILDRMCFYDF